MTDHTPTTGAEESQAIRRATWLAPTLVSLIIPLYCLALPDAYPFLNEIVGLSLFLAVPTIVIQGALTLALGPDRAAMTAFALSSAMMVGTGGVTLAVTTLLLSIVVTVALRGELVRIFLFFVVISTALLNTNFVIRIGLSSWSHPYVAAPAPLATTREPFADVWWIVLDGYPRADQLERDFGVHSGLDGPLRERGFSVGPRARANHSQTLLALSTALNGETMAAMIGDNPDNVTRQSLRMLMNDNRVSRSLQAAGYYLVSYKSAYSVISVPSDEVRGPRVLINEVENGIYSLTMLPKFVSALGFSEGAVGYRARRNHLQATVNDLGTYVHPSRPTFTFAHITAPHPPFVFDADGATEDPKGHYALHDGSHWILLHPEEDYVDGFAGMVAWLSPKILEAVDRIRANGRPSIILIHADHGPGSRLDWDERDYTDVTERMTILNALYLPSGGAALLPPDFTPIDASRAILNEALGASLPIREERSYYSGWPTPFDFEDVTDELRVSGDASTAQTPEPKAAEAIPPNTPTEPQPD